MTKIYDCFLFFDEFDILELRLKTLSDHVDVFVLVESKFTFTGKEKPLYFFENQKRFEPWLHKIRHVIIEDKLETDNAWNTEYRDRNQISRGLYDANLNDIIFISDCDEIWNPAKKYHDLDVSSNVRFMQYVHYYFLNCRQMNKVSPRCTVRVRYKNFTSAQSLRSDPTALRVDEGGWHFSYAGNVERIIYKLKSFAHTEYSTDFWTDKSRIEEKLVSCEDLFDRGTKYQVIPIDESFPKPLQENPNTWKHLIKNV